jgi:hypothetical protein
VRLIDEGEDDGRADPGPVRGGLAVHDEVVAAAGTGAAGLPQGQRIVSLPGGLAMVPVTRELAAGLDPAAVGDERVSPRWPLLRQPVAALARQVSAGRRALYIAGETFGGPGIQEAVGWQDGRLLYGPSGTCDVEADLEPGYHLIPRRDGAINAGLRVLGVRADQGRDEYETIGLPGTGSPSGTDASRRPRLTRARPAGPRSAPRAIHE